MTHQPSTVAVRSIESRKTKGAGAPTGWRLLVRRIRRQPLTLIAVSWLLLVVLGAIFADVIAPYDPLQNDFRPDAVLTGPTAEHWLGTDENGRDVLSRIIYGARIALAVGFGSVVVAMLIGVPLGLLLGYRGGWWDRLGTRFVDIIDALPGMLVAFAIIAILGRGLTSIMLAIGLIFCMNFARMARAITLAEGQKPYIEAAKVSGLREVAILFRQILPNLAGPLIVQGAILTGTAIVIESALSFLGIGLESSVPSWGGLLGIAAAKQALQPFLAFPPGLVIILTVLSFNLLGDGISEALQGDKRTKVKLTQADRAQRSAAALSAAPADPDNILEIRDVTVEFQRQHEDPLPLVKDASLTVRRGEIVGLLGESGSGKSTLARAVLGLLPPGLTVASGAILLDGQDIAESPEKKLRVLRGSQLAAVFQDPMAALSPVHTIGKQLSEPLRAHFKLSRAEARKRAAELLDRVGVKNAADRLGDYPHQFSGGMAQRVAIAIALAANPQLVIADEATSALDVTTQAQVLDLLLDLRDEFGMAILLITHDLGVVAEACDRAAIMYKGEIVEVTRDAASLFDAPQDPYTVRLLAARERRPREANAAVSDEHIVTIDEEAAVK
ncbi:dipeptide/oligopeptide/nickel ABC transporter permease/ATP-binding protein [Microbacterium phosphatis]|uniref:dipeptide/oligopeptide/nickel ABC transporter permease/ATP-binding protein n=1 Tax=Microbacterium phosphatis TaxID=3140248 RepID=UPI0031407DAE